MLSVLLTILKIIGIILLILLGILILALMLILFVPFRYKISGYRKEELESPVYAKIKLSWLLHIITVAYRYPEAAYIRIKCFGITIYDASREKKIREKKDTEKKDKEKKDKKRDGNKPEESDASQEIINDESEEIIKEEGENTREGVETTRKNRFLEFFYKLINIFKNIWYTIRKLYANIKDIILNIKYYVDIFKSDQFKQAYSLCSRQLLRIWKNVRPKKWRVTVVAGTTDPALTGQILEIYSILYPIIGNNVFITPDFEHEVLEGEFCMKGRVTVQVLLWAMLLIYKDPNIRKVWAMLKREEA